jgi:hypothetical protein
MPEVSPGEKGSQMVALLQIKCITLYTIRSQEANQSIKTCRDTFQQEFIDQIVVVPDAFSVDSTAQTSICH